MATTLLDQHNPQQFVTIFPYTQRYMSSSALVEETYLCNKETEFQKTPIHKNAELKRPVPFVTTPRARGTLWYRGQKDCKSQRIRGVAVRLCLLGMESPIPTYSQHYGCSNVS